MITRTDIITKIRYPNGASSVNVGDAANEILDLLKGVYNEHRELIDACTVFREFLDGSATLDTPAGARFKLAIAPYVPEVSVSAVLEEIITGGTTYPELEDKLRSCADRVRVLEEKTRLQDER